MTEFDPSLGARRRFLGSLAAAGVGALVPGRVLAQAAHAVAKAPPRTVIDVHFHYYAPEYLAAWQAYVAKNPGGGGLPPAVRGWTPQWAIEHMDQAGIKTCVLSLPSTPGVWFGADAAGMQRMSRLCNEFAAKMVRDYPGRFGLFASLPMPDVDGALKEIDHAFGALKADGINLMTSFGNKWPGDPLFDPVFQELNRRKAVVYFHPYAPNCCAGLMPAVPESWIEYPYDTGRTITNLLFTGSFARYRDIKWVFSHGGGTIPFLAGRIQNQSHIAKNLHEVAPDGVYAELKRLYYDTANAAYPPTLAALTRLIATPHILYGSDVPYLTEEQNLKGLRSYGFPAATLAAIEHGNAQALIPRLRA
jgi:predicted TIM-barrel fold metal-dependent hydrolase